MTTKLDVLLDKYAGNLSWRIINDADIPKREVYKRVKNGELEQVYRGLFVDSGAFEDWVFLVQQKFSFATVSHESALAYHHLSNVLPERLHFSFPQGYHLSKNATEKFFLTPHYVNKETHTLGVEIGKSSMGNPIKIYNRERTICDVWSPWSTTLTEYRQEAIKNYMNDPNRDTLKLLEYSRKLVVEKELLSIIEILM